MQLSCLNIFITLFLSFEGKWKRFLHGDLICRYTLSKYMSDIYVDGLSIISVKKTIMKVMILSIVTYLLRLLIMKFLTLINNA